MTSPAPPRPMVTPAPPGASDGGRFLPGQILVDRYRMVGLLGRGGMGEVYRADDLKLGQPVALKFLPRDVETDPERLERFLTEVRLSLRVTHPNVCRVFDIGEVDGRHFLSMEYVDGEDLASLLRRIGRLPEDKAVQIARQLSVGLAAAHDEGVLHRDLKPANVMIDGRGRAKITDFGLAGATAGIAGHEARAGTPQYMAPEQFEGGELTVQTDLYSLGLVLYELFTGKRAFESRDVNELAAMRTSTPTSPTAHVAGLDPVVERAIMRCLDPDPAARPRSAASLAAALPGGDPLAMALAAGETPSPEMVARSGGRGELRPLVAIGCLATVLAGLVVVWIAAGRIELQNVVPLPKPPFELQVAARTRLVAAGYAGAPTSTVYGFERDADYFTTIEKDDQSPDRWDNLASVTPAPVWFWYRESARPMSPFAAIGTMGPSNPPLSEPGMMRVRLDPAGRLQELLVVPPDREDTPGPWAEPDWAPLFAAAGFTPDEWSAAEPVWAPPVASDVRRAWTRDALRIEAASFRGRPVWFRVVPTWRQPVDAKAPVRTIAERTAPWAIQGVALLVMLGGAVLARRNMRLGRSDRRGAFRLAAVYVAIGAAYEVLQLAGEPAEWFTLFTRNLALQLNAGAVVWLFYVAIEPYVRRLWPGTLIAWSRVLDGRVRDPMVGRHLLLGAMSGLGFTLLFSLPTLAAPILSAAAPAPLANLDALASTGARLGVHFFVLQASFFIPVTLLLGVLVFRVVLRRPWVAYTALFGVLGVVLALGPGPWVSKALAFGMLALSALVLTRLGLFALLVSIAFSSWDVLPLTTDASSWFFPASIVTMLLFAGVAVYGFIVSLGDQKVFKDTLFGER